MLIRSVDKFRSRRNTSLLPLLFFTTLLTGCGSESETSGLRVATPETNEESPTQALPTPDIVVDSGTQDTSSPTLTSVDTDSDGISNETDPDDDNDGVNDVDDTFPLDPLESVDSDNDGIGDAADVDSDNDGVPDVSDHFPLDADEQWDTDGDGQGNSVDTDDDNDGIEDFADNDNDNDGVFDYEDALPYDADETKDFDGDYIGDNRDSDDDNDGIDDTSDAQPYNESCSAEDEVSGGECIVTIMVNSEQVGSDANGTVYFTNSNQSALYPYSLQSNQIQPPIGIDEGATGDFQITALHFSELHDRLYFGTSDSRFGYINDAGRSTILRTFAGAIKQIVTYNQGFWVVAGETSGLSSSTQVDKDGLELLTLNDSICSNAQWNATNDMFVCAGTRLGGSKIYSSSQVIGPGPYEDSFSAFGNLAPLVFSPDEKYVLTGSSNYYEIGTNQYKWIEKISDVNFVDLHWKGDTILGLQTYQEPLPDNEWEYEKKTRLLRFDADWNVVESINYPGEALKLVPHNDQFYVVTKGESMPHAYPFSPSEDSDNDFVTNTEDAFPTDPAASVDSDNDGYPDKWNAGYSQSDSNTELVLDHFPTQGACHDAAETSNELCTRADITHGPDAVVDYNGVVYILYSNEKLLFRYDLAAKSDLPSLSIPGESGAKGPEYMSVSAQHNRLYFGYQSGRISYISLDGTSSRESILTYIPKSMEFITSIGDYLYVEGTASSRHHYYIDRSGDVLSRFYKSQNSGEVRSGFHWDESSKRLYFIKGREHLSYDQISDDGKFVSTTDLVDDLSATYGQLLVSPDKSKFLLGSGQYYDWTSGALLGSIEENFNSSLEEMHWLPDGRLAVTSSDLYSLNYDKSIYLFDENLQLENTQVTEFDPIHLTVYDGELIMMEHDSGRFVVTTIE